MKIARLILLLLALPAAVLAADERAPHRGPVKVVADQRLEVKASAGTGSVPIYVLRDWTRPQPEVRRALVVLHGRLRNADVYLRSAQEAQAAAGTAGRDTLLVLPQFLATPDIAGHQLPAQMLRWGPDGWMGGEAATAPAPLSAFDVLDAILARLADRTIFPNLAHVVLAGHSGGAQVVHRYAIVGKGEAALANAGVPVRYVVANPSSYLYFSAERPASVEGCVRYNHWKYGWDEAPPYAREKSPEAYEKAYAARDVVYLLGADDTDPRHPALDRSCGARAEGPQRRARGMAYFEHIKARNPGTRQQLRVIPGVGHEGDRMLTSACGLAALFDRPGCVPSTP